MSNNTLSGLILTSGIVISGAIIGLANAQVTTVVATSEAEEQEALDGVQYPVQELGGCKDQKACKAFCDNQNNANACLLFAEQHNLMSSNEVAFAKKFIDNEMAGPGSCKGQDECDQYCGDSAHLEECIAFAQKNGMMTPEQQQDSQKVLTAIKNGVKPPACSGPRQCDEYCGTHMEECMTFSLAAGLVPEREKEQVQKTLEAIKKGIKPPACHGREECDTYCSDPGHMEECVAFSLAAGLMPEGEKEQVKKMLDAAKKGIKPPACRPSPPPGRSGPRTQSGVDLQACDQYCAEDSHVEECVKFSVAMGNMTEQQAKTAIKTGGKGPGGCIGREACEAFCNNLDNQETCFQFGKENGMIPPEDLQRMEEGQQKMKDSFSQIPQEVLDCLTSSLGADIVEKMRNGSFVPQKSGDAIGQCFQKFAPQGEMRDDRNFQDRGQPGQGGSSDMSGDLRECLESQVGEDGLEKIRSGRTDDPVVMGKAKTCFERYGQQGERGQEGKDFQPGPGMMNPGGQQMPQQAGPGGCKGPEECKTYCESHQDECKSFQPRGGEPGQPGQSEGQPGQMRPSQPGQMQPVQLDRPIDQNQPGQFMEGRPGQPGQFIEGQPRPMQPGQIQPPQEMEPRFIQGQPNQPGQFIQGEPGQMEPPQPGFIEGQPGQVQPLPFNQLEQIQPQQEPQPQFQPPPPVEQDLPPPPSSFLQTMKEFLANVFSAFE